MKKVLINQPDSWGDIMFCQGIAQNYLTRGVEVLWPVSVKYLDFAKKHYPRVNWVSKNSVPQQLLRLKVHGVRDGVEILPLTYAREILRSPESTRLTSKYQLAGLDWKLWRKYAEWERDYVKEEELLEVVDAVGGYALVNRNYGISRKRKEITPKTTLRVVEQDYLDGFSPLDWGLVYQRATEIHSVVTSNIYLMELLKLSATKLKLYQNPNKSLNQFGGLLTKNYICL